MEKRVCGECGKEYEHYWDINGSSFRFSKNRFKIPNDLKRLTDYAIVKK
jgi:hypothetical protein